MHALAKQKKRHMTSRKPKRRGIDIQKRSNTHWISDNNGTTLSSWCKILQEAEEKDRYKNEVNRDKPVKDIEKPSSTCRKKESHEANKMDVKKLEEILSKVAKDNQEVTAKDYPTVSEECKEKDNELIK